MKLRWGLSAAVSLLLVLPWPAMAEGGKIKISKRDCRRLVQHSPSAGVEYQPGKDARGRFVKGNPGGPGNPHAQRIGKLRSVLIETVTEDDMRAIVRNMIAMARNSNMRAAKEIFDRTLGKPQETDLIERLEQLEALLTELPTR